MRRVIFLLFCVTLALTPKARAVDPALQFGATPTEAAALKAANNDHTAYTLPPEKLAKAVVLGRTFTTFEFVHEGWNILQLVLFLSLGIAAWMQRVAVARSSNRWLQGAVFCFLLLALHTLLNLPLQIYGHHVVMKYGLSIQGWGSWALDLLKSLAVFYLLGTLGVMGFFWTVRRSPQRWWLWFAGLVSVAIVAGAFATPYVYDPLFNKFTPMQKTNPELVAELEKVVARGGKGISIPPERMFIMKASDKVTTTNAYVTGFGGSKRVVVWDTSLASGNRDDVLAIFAHEMGHYVLGHVALGMGLSMLSLVLEFWLGYRAARWLIRRFGERWQVGTQQDWAALVVFLLVLAVFSFLTEPVANGVSRWMEHNADVYGQEALHGIVADPAAVTAASFQHLGEQALDDPKPEEWVELWLDTHPSIGKRAAFAKHYDPWGVGEKPKYFER